MPRMPQHGWRDAVRVLEELGFEFQRVTATNHLAYWKKGLSRPVIVPKYDALPKMVVSNILKTGKIDRDEYIRILTRNKKTG